MEDIENIFIKKILPKRADCGALRTEICTECLQMRIPIKLRIAWDDFQHIFNKHSVGNETKRSAFATLLSIGITMPLKPGPFSAAKQTSEGETIWLLACQTVVHFSLTKGFSACKTLEIVVIDVWTSDIYSSNCSF